MAGIDARDPGGYGEAPVNKRQEKAHRIGVSLVLFIGLQFIYKCCDYYSLLHCLEVVEELE